MIQKGDGQRSCRLDQWLVAARFFKTRPLAVSAIQNGRAMVNGERAKPARSLHIGDVLYIQKTPSQIFEVAVEVLANKRVNAKIASTFYRETENGKKTREALEAQNKLAQQMVQFPKARPNKHERRQLRQLRHQDFL